MDRAANSWVWPLLSFVDMDMHSLVGFNDGGVSLHVEEVPKSVAAAVMGDGPPAASAPLFALLGLVGVIYFASGLIRKANWCARVEMLLYARYLCRNRIESTSDEGRVRQIVFEV